MLLCFYFSGRQVGKALSGWTAVDAFGGIGGGHPPSLKAVKNNSEVPHHDKVEAFCLSLYGDFIDAKTLDPGLASLVTASILRHFDKFVDVVATMEEPNDQLSGLPYHPFIIRLFTAAQSSGIPWESAKETLYSWNKAVTRDFIQKNYSYVPLQDVQAAGVGEQVCVNVLMSACCCAPTRNVADSPFCFLLCCFAELCC